MNNQIEFIDFFLSNGASFDQVTYHQLNHLYLFTVKDLILFFYSFQLNADQRFDYSKEKKCQSLFHLDRRNVLFIGKSILFRSEWSESFISLVDFSSSL